MTNIKKARVAGMESKRGNVGEREIKRPGNEGAFGWWKGSEILKKLFLLQNITVCTICTHNMTPHPNHFCEGGRFKEIIFKSSSHSAWSIILLE